MLSLCELINTVEDWSVVTDNGDLQRYASKVHDHWHEVEEKVKSRSFNECKADINVCYADILRAVDLWIESAYGNAAS